MVYRYGQDVERPESLIHGGLAVPLEETGSRLGTSRSTRDSEADASTTRTCAGWRADPRRAAPAIENARKFREARQLADLDALTGLHNRRYFHETLARESPALTATSGGSR